MDYRADLKERIEKFEERISLDSVMLSSLAATSKEEGKFDPLEFECDITYYRELIEGITLFRLYNDHFFDPELKERQELYEKHLETINEYHIRKERRLAGILNSISNLNSSK